MYTIETFESEISVEEYLENYVDVPVFLEACRACPNFGKTWSCPEYDFDVMEYWHKYRTLHLFARKMILNPELTAQTYTQEKQQAIIQQIFWKEKQDLSTKLFELEKQIPGSISLSAGNCQLCKDGCTKPLGKPCRFPDQLRYSIESLGGNVGLTIEKLMKLKIEWMEENRLPHHFVLVCGILIP